MGELQSAPDALAAEDLCGLFGPALLELRCHAVGRAGAVAGV